MLSKKKKPFNPYENRVDDLIHVVWEARPSDRKSKASHYALRSNQSLS